MSDSVEIENLAAALSTAMAEYSEELTEQVMKTIDEETKESLKELKENSPKQTGSYSKGWRSKTDYTGKYSKTNTVYNRTDYQLTHLLEYGHAKRHGGRVAGIVHIKPVETQAMENIIRKIEEAAHGNS